jgi:hypothetical protein
MLPIAMVSGICGKVKKHTRFPILSSPRMRNAAPVRKEVKAYAAITVGIRPG